MEKAAFCSPLRILSVFCAIIENKWNETWYRGFETYQITEKGEFP